MKSRDNVLVVLDDGREIGGTIINVNEYREHSMMYAVELDDGLGLVFVGIDNLKKGEDKNE